MLPRFFLFSVRSAVIGIALVAGASFAESGPSSPSITDDAAIFRQNQKLKAELNTEAEALTRDTGVVAILKTVAFIAGETTASQARELAESQSSNQAVAVVLYVRGNRSAGIGTNTAFDAIVPTFELSSLPQQGADENADAAEQIADSYRRLLLLVRRYTDKSPQVAAASTRIAEHWLLAAVLASSAAIVGTCAWCTRPETSKN